MTAWQPFDEPLRATLARTVGIAIIGGGVLAFWRGGLAWWPLMSALVLWPSLGGHWLEVWFLNWLRPRLPNSRGVQIGARVVVWFIGGMVFALGMGLTAMVLTGVRRSAPAVWWVAAGLAFIGIELVAHLGLQLRGRPSFFNGRG